MDNPRTSTATIIAALYILAEEIKTDDGRVYASLFEAAQRLEEYFLYFGERADGRNP